MQDYEPFDNIKDFRNSSKDIFSLSKNGAG